MILKKAFPNLYNIARLKDASIAINLDFASESLQWNVSFIRTACDWEADVLASIYTLFYSHSVRSEGKEKLW